jgi:cyclase
VLRTNVQFKLNRHTFAAAMAAAALLMMAPVRAGLQITFPIWESVIVQDRDLGGHVHVLQGFGGNIGLLLSGAGIFVVDAEYPQLTNKLLAKIRSLSDQPLRYLVDTHFHWDHVGGNAGLAQQGAKIIASPETIRHIQDAQSSGRALPDQYPPDPLLVPTIEVKRKMTLGMGEEIVEIYHIRHAHTDGDLIVRFVRADVIHTGDAFFNGFYPYIDVAHGGSIDQAIAFCDQLYALATPRTRIIPGHGEVTNREYIKEYQAMLRTVRDRVAAAIRAGRSSREIIAAHPLVDLESRWGSGVTRGDDFLEMVYADLTRTPSDRTVRAESAHDNQGMK